LKRSTAPTAEPAARNGRDPEAESDRAARDGVVERRSDRTDRRLARAWPAKEGRALIRSLLPPRARRVHDLLRGIAAQERRELRRLLGGLREHLGARTA